MDESKDKSAKPATATEEASPSDFIRDAVAADLADGKHTKIVTRFPPEPNGYLHIGHAKSICLNFGIAREYDGACNLRMDDTNPTKEEAEYVQRIQEDVHWLIDGWADHVIGLKARGDAGDGARECFYASGYFDRLHDYAVRLVERGMAYVCDLNAEELAEHRGAPDRPGRNSPYRDRSVEENLDLFARMKAGEFADGAKTLRARIDMASPNLHLRDPALYRIRHAEHHRTGNAWCIYPMYDYAHCLSDYIEGVTHSICTLEFEVHRPLYDWILEALDLTRPLPRQYEFARLSLSYTVMSKRKLLQLVRENRVQGWNDPRMPTLSGLRRRGVPPEAIRDFCARLGVTKYDSQTDVALLEHGIRTNLNRWAARRLGVLRPLKVLLTNYPEEKVEQLDAVNNPEDPDAGKRQVPFSRELYIEHDDFMEEPPHKYFRLRPGGEVRLKYAYIVRCDEVVKDDSGDVIELRCTADLESKRGGASAARKVKGTIHWVSAPHAIEAEVRVYDRLFTIPEPDEGGERADFTKHLNPDSLTVARAKLEPSLAGSKPGTRYQFERLGYFCVDSDSGPRKLVFNRTLPLRDTWAKKVGKR